MFLLILICVAKSYNTLHFFFPSSFFSWFSSYIYILMIRCVGCSHIVLKKSLAYGKLLLQT